MNDYENERLEGMKQYQQSKNTMNQFIESQRELAREHAVDMKNVGFAFYGFGEQTLDALITQIITNLGVELVRLAEVLPPNPDNDAEGDIYQRGYNRATSNMKEHITNLTGVK